MVFASVAGCNVAGSVDWRALSRRMSLSLEESDWDIMGKIIRDSKNATWMVVY